MPLHAALEETSHAYKYVFPSPIGNQSTELHMEEIARLLEKDVHFWLGVGLNALEICAISG